MNDAQRIKEKAVELGFEIVGITPSTPPPDLDYFRWWLDQGYAGTMGYLARGLARRSDPEAILPGVRSVICCAMNYYLGETPTGFLSEGKISRYAWGSDYHEVLLHRLSLLEEFIHSEISPKALTRCTVDTGAVLERSYAERAGLGWIGKNTCLINYGLGSYLFLGEILTTLKLTYDRPTFDQCGTCTKCLEACPTGALIDPYQMDARKCISYLTIEYREDFTREQEVLVGEHLFGCDICQEVCPYNSGIPETQHPEFTPRNEWATMTRTEMEDLSGDEWNALTRDSAMNRIKFPHYRKNLETITRNRINPPKN